MTGAATERLLAALEKNGATIKNAPHGWLATCPVPSHEDRHPSFHVEEGNGLVLYRCRSGCDQAVVTDALKALGLTTEDLYDNRRGVEYTYRDKPGGRVLRSVKRFNRDGEKSFAQTGPQARAGHGAALYRPDDFDLESVVAAGQEVWIAEGEKDADTLYRHGVAAVSSAAGAQSWHKFDYAPVAKASRVTIVADDDDAGRARAHGLYNHLVQAYDANVRVVLPMAGKDATDHLLQGLTVSDFQEIPGDPEFEEAVAEQRRIWKITREAKRRDGAAFAAAAIENFKPKTLGEIQDAEEQERNWVIPDLLERHERLIMTGAEGGGKSHWMRQVMITTAAGVHPFHPYQQINPTRVLAIDAENTELQWQRATKYITSLALRIGQVSPRDRIMVQAGFRLDFTQHAHIDIVHKWITEWEPDIVYLGPLYKLMPKEVTNDDDAAPLLKALDEIRERGVALLMEAHAGKAKDQGGERNLAPRGSSALLGWPEFGYGLRPSVNDPDMAIIVPWRGDREQRPWPKVLRRGVDGEYPWMSASIGA
jgi:hypothetical protein